MLFSLFCPIALGIFLLTYAHLQARRAEAMFPPCGEFVVVEGVRLHYLRRGKGKTIVLLHGSEGFLQDFTPLFNLLATEYDVIAFDRPGHGYSDAPHKNRITPASQARLIYAALERLGVVGPVLVGHSWSGLLLLHYALEFPKDVSRLVLISPWIYPSLAFPSPLLWIPLIPLVGPWLSMILLMPVKRILMRYHLARAFFPQPIPHDYAVLANALWQRYPRQITTFAQENTLNVKMSHALALRYSEIDLPVTILTGDLDRTVKPTDQAFRLHATLPHSHLIILPGHGHALLFSAPEIIFAHLKEVLQKDVETLSNESREEEKASKTRSDAKARTLVMRYGWNSVAYQILNPEMEHWFSEDGEAVIGFVRRNGVRIVAGAPICEEGQLASIIAKFEKIAQTQGERVCYFGATDRLRKALGENSFHSALPIGAQPVWKLSNWEEVIRKNSSLRSQINRAKNKGVNVDEWDAARAAESASLQRCLTEWLTTHPFPTLHFLTEPVTLNRLEDRRLFVAIRDETPIGFLISTPIPRRNGWLIEQIVRGKDAPNGTTELLVQGAMQTLAAEGYETVTLGLAPLSRRAALQVTPTQLWLRLLFRWMRAHGKRFYNFEGLDTFKAKFKPDVWEPIYALSNEEQFSPHTLYALAAAFSDGTPVGAVSRALVSALRQEIKWTRKKKVRE